MGEGLKRVARQCGGMRVSVRGETCDYVPNTNALGKIKTRKADGWNYVGLTDDSEFLRFTIATDAIPENYLHDDGQRT